MQFHLLCWAKSTDLLFVTFNPRPKGRGNSGCGNHELPPALAGGI